MLNYSVSIEFGKQSKQTINKHRAVLANGWFRVSIEDKFKNFKRKQNVN
jgi:hypothetical protein